MSHVPSSGPVCRCVAFPHITCELVFYLNLVYTPYLNYACLPMRELPHCAMLLLLHQNAEERRL